MQRAPRGQVPRVQAQWIQDRCVPVPRFCSSSPTAPPSPSAAHLVSSGKWESSRAQAQRPVWPPPRCSRDAHVLRHSAFSCVSVCWHQRPLAPDVNSLFLSSPACFSFLYCFQYSTHGMLRLTPGWFYFERRVILYYLYTQRANSTHVFSC